MRSENPIFKKMFSNLENETYLKPMTIEGTVNKFCLLMIFILATAAIIWYQFTLQRIDFVYVLGFAGMIIGAILSFIIAFVPKTAKTLSPIYAICQGAFIGAISCIFEAQVPGVVIKAVATTIIVGLSVGILYRLEIIKATEKFKAILVSATIAIMLFYLIAFVMSLLGVHLSYFENSNTPIYIALNIGIAIIATLNLVLDFDYIEKAIQMGSPDYYEWYGAHGLIVTLVWMYIEILRLLMRMSKR